MVTRDCGVRVDVSGQHGQAARHVLRLSLHHPSSLSPFDLNVV